MLEPATLDFRTFTAPDRAQVPEGCVNLNVFRTVFAGDLPKATAAQLAVSQRPPVASALGDTSGPPAWKSIKSFYLLRGADRAIGTDVEQVRSAPSSTASADWRVVHVPTVEQRLVADRHGREGAWDRAGTG